MKKLLLLIVIIFCAASSFGQQRIYNQTLMTVGGGIIKDGGVINAGIEQIIKSSRNSIFAELSYHHFRKMDDIEKLQVIICPSYGYYLTTGKFLLNLKAGIPLGVENLKIPSFYSTTLPSSKFIIGMHLSTQAELNVSKIINIYAEPFYQYYFQNLSISNIYGIKIGLKFYL